MELNKRIIELGNIRDTETYLNSPINVNFLASDSIINTTDVEFYISLKSNTSFEYSLDEDGPLDIYPYGKTFNTPAGDIVVTPNFTNFSNLKDRNIGLALSHWQWWPKFIKNKFNPCSRSTIFKYHNNFFGGPNKTKRKGYTKYVGCQL